MLRGQCHCGAVSYEIPAETTRQGLCHCTDCRRHAGAPVVAWAVVPADAIRIDGSPKIYKSSEHGRRSFCETCGTGLFYTNEAIMPGVIDIQIATLDEPERVPPQAQIQLAERISWMATLEDIPTFERYPGMD